MSNEWAKSVEQLEQATGNANHAADSPDEEIAALREGWLEFSRLLNAADKGHAARSVNVTAPSLRTTTASNGRSYYSFVAVVGSLAAMFVLWALLSSRLPPSEHRKEVVQSHSSAAVDDATVISPAASGVSRTNLEFAWHDSFDDQLARANQGLWEVQDSRLAEGRWDYLSTEFSELGEELDRGSL